MNASIPHVMPPHEHMPVPEHLRHALPPEPKRPLLVFEGAQRRRQLIVYAAIHVVLFGGLAYTAATNPLLVVFGLLLCYALENLMFVFGHVALHALFIEFKESEMMTIGHHSFVHHYRNIRAYHQSWLASRLSYFYCPQLGLLSSTTHGYLIMQLLTAGIITMFDWRAGLCALACMWAMRSLQSICHEYYHHNDRPSFYSLPTRLLLEGLEAIGILSTRRHLIHHRHHLRNLHQVSEWTDMWMPGAERVGRALWSRLLTLYIPGQQKMIDSIRWSFLRYAALNYGVIIVAFVTMAKLLD